MMENGLIMGLIVGGFSISKVSAMVTPTPSTNDANRSYGWAHVDQVGQGIGTVDLQFISTRSFASCFEYRTDGDTSQQTSPNNYNTLITDGLYPYYCQNNSNSTHTFNANEYVEVRMVFGAESDERFDWTKFEVGKDTNKSVKVEASCDGSAVVTIYGGDTRRTWRVDGVEQWVERYSTVEFSGTISSVIEWKHNGNWELANEEQYVTRNEAKDCVVTEQPREDHGMPGAPVLPTCPGFWPVGPSKITFKRLSPTDLAVWWNKIDSFVSSYVVSYGPAKNLLVWNTIVSGSEYTELHQLPANQHIWVGIQESNAGCVGVMGSIVDP